MLKRFAAIFYAIISLPVVIFQVTVAAGAPWGEFAMGGVSPGQFPPALRIAALVQAGLLILLALVVLARAGVILPRW